MGSADVEHQILTPKLSRVQAITLSLPLQPRRARKFCDANPQVYDKILKKYTKTLTEFLCAI